LVLPALDFLTLGAQVCQHFVDAVLVDDSKSLVSDAQADVTLLGLDPESLVLQVRQKPAPRFVVGMGNVVAALRALPGNLADLRHEL